MNDNHCLDLAFLILQLALKEKGKGFNIASNFLKMSSKT